ncbi:MAG: anaerobic ribonucleoside-triphosphate reductase activating protein [Oscillospiraceae bacterium]|nr:anaerobic ribonucleoside-triphosphate reductase activating protein [Oscillospiraceae bacterium]
MKISGLLKLSALDYPGKIACTVFTHGCPFRCPFCHNAALVTEKEEEGISEEEFFAFLNKRRGILDGVAVTGGEPLMRADLPDFLRGIKDMGYLVKLDTNGYYPDTLQKCIEAGLVDFIAMDIKNSPAKYAQSCGRESVDMEKIRRSVEIIKNSGVDYEFRTTAVAGLHEDADFPAMGEMIKGAKAWYIQLFKDSGGLISDGLIAPSAEDMERWKALAMAYADIVELRGI